MRGGGDCYANKLKLIVDRRIQELLMVACSKIKETNVKDKLEKIIEINQKKIYNLILLQTCTTKTESSLKRTIEGLKNPTTRKNLIRWMIYSSPVERVLERAH